MDINNVISNEKLKAAAFDSSDKWNAGDEHVYGFMEGFKFAQMLANDAERSSGICHIQNVSGSISLELATKRIRQAVQYGKYKEWNSRVGEQKAQSIMDDFYNGLYGSDCGMWVQVNEAVELMESLFCR